MVSYESELVVRISNNRFLFCGTTLLKLSVNKSRMLVIWSFLIYCRWSLNTPRNKVNSIQSSWVKSPDDYCFHEWEIIPLYHLNKTFGPSFKFHSIFFNKSYLKKLIPCFVYMLISWSPDLSGSPETSQILFSFCGLKITLKLRVLQYIFQNPLIKVLTSYCSYVKMAGSYHGLVWAI